MQHPMMYKVVEYRSRNKKINDRLEKQLLRWVEDTCKYFGLDFNAVKSYSVHTYESGKHLLEVNK